MTHLGVAARLDSPALGAAVLFGRVLRMDPAEVRWPPVLGGPPPLSLPAPVLTWRGAQPGGGAAPGELRQSVLDGPVRTLTRVTAAMSVSPKVLQGNIAAAVNAAASLIATARPGLATQAATIRARCWTPRSWPEPGPVPRPGSSQAKLLPDLPGRPRHGRLRGLHPEHDVTSAGTVMCISRSDRPIRRRGGELTDR